MKPPIAPIFRNRFAFPLAVTLAGTLLLAGCLTPADQETRAVAEPSPAALSREEGFKVLESMGFSRDKIEATGTAFIVEGDMVFTSEGLALARAQDAPLAKTAQRAETAVKFPKPNLLKVVIHSSMTDWAKLVHQAVNHWNAPNTRLHLEIVPEGGDITIYSDASASCPAEVRNLPPATSGMGQQGMNGFPGSAIAINKDGLYMETTFQRIGVITHELGHTIGFQHTDSQDGVLVPGTPETDHFSVMKSSPGGIAPTYNDVRALEVLYNSDKVLGGTDLDRDGRDDIVYWRPSNGMWSYLKSSTGFSTSTGSAFGQRGDLPLADTDLDGDGTDDRVIWRGSLFRAILSSTGALREFSLGSQGDVPIGNHDMDGDGKDDLVVWHTFDCTFYVLTSRSNFATTVSYPWGDFGDIPVGGIDADRDGKDDFVIWRGRQRLFWVRFSASNFTTSAPYFMGGKVGDIPMGSTDLDRDSWDDLTVWRPESGNWYALTSGSNFGSGATNQWGMRGDVPIIGTDIDQDGRKDIVVWRPSDATWYIKKSNTNFNTWIGYVWGQ